MRSRSNARRSSAIGAMDPSWPVTGSRTMVPSSNVAKRAPGACNAQRPGAPTAAADTRGIPGEGRSVRRDRAPGRVVQALQAGAEHPARVDAVDAAVLVEEDQRIDMALLLDFLDEERIERHQAVDLRVARRLTELVGRDAGLGATRHADAVGLAEGGGFGARGAGARAAGARAVPGIARTRGRLVLAVVLGLGERILDADLDELDLGANP